MRRSVSMWASVLAAGALLSLTACGESAADDAGEASGASGQPASAAQATVDRYESTKGRITAVPVADSPTQRDLRIHHEEMPAFKGQGGKLGMNEMTMPFPLGEGVSLEGFEIGDPVEFDWEVQWDASPPYYITAIRKLPVDTKLPLKMDPVNHDHSHGDHDHDHGDHDHSHGDHDHGDG